MRAWPDLQGILRKFRRAFVLAIGVALWAAPAQADWQLLAGDEIADAVLARTLVFRDGIEIGFTRDGRVLFGRAWGRWRADALAGQLCVLWPPGSLGPGEICYLLARDRIDLRLSANDGTVLVGRYIDLN